MSCSSCGNNTPITYYYNGTPCTTNTNQSNGIDSINVMYTGQILGAINVNPNTNLQEILSSINASIAGISGIDWGSFNYSCIPGPITNAQQFAEGISSFVCSSNSQFEDFVNTTFPQSLQSITDDIDALNSPNITSCSFIGIGPTDDLNTIVDKLQIAVCTLYTDSNPSSANWNACFSTPVLPTNITEGFNVLLSQICSIKTDVSGLEPLPTFDNTNTCLPSPTTTDSLVKTVTGIRNILCSQPTFNIDDLVWTNCIPNPNIGGGADLISALQAIITPLSSTFQNRVVTWDNSFFDVSLSDPSSPCSGFNVSVQSGVGLTDELVALNASDANPGYLLDKMLQGSNIDFDTTTTPGSVIINSTAEDVFVKANAADTSSGYLIDKVDGKADASGAISISETYNTVTDKVDLTPSINYGILTTQILDIITNNGTLYSQLQSIFCSMTPCPTGDERSISGQISVAPGSDPVEFILEFDQGNPLLAMYNSASVSATGGTVITTGAYQVTSAASSVAGTVTLQNLNPGAALPYQIYVTDLVGNSIAGSSSQTGSIPASGVLTIDPFIYGSAVNLVLHVDIGNGLITTTTSSTTTTTTTLP